MTTLGAVANTFGPPIEVEQGFVVGFCSCWEMMRRHPEWCAAVVAEHYRASSDAAAEKGRSDPNVAGLMDALVQTFPVEVR